MPRYTQSGGEKGYRKKYKTASHDDASTILKNLTPVQFRQLQEIAKHGLGMHTMFRELLSEHPKKKVKPSSFAQFANAQSPEEVVHGMHIEKEGHSDHTSETHMGGGLREAYNAVGSWAFDVSTLDHMNWALDTLDPKTTQKSDKGGQLPAPKTDDDAKWIQEILNELKKHEDKHHHHHTTVQPTETPIIQTGNQVMDTMGWIGGILGSTVDFLSDFDHTDD